MKFTDFPLLALAASVLLFRSPVQAAVAGPLAPLIEERCADCHDADEKKGGLDLTSLAFSPGDAGNFATWVKVHDRVVAGEMPPKKKGALGAAEMQSFIKAIAPALDAADSARIASEGRATKRRLNRYEYEETLRDLLSLPGLAVKDFLPEDSEAHGFNKCGDALDVSHVQMARYLQAADFALRQALAPHALKPEKSVARYATWDQPEFVSNVNQVPALRRTFPLQGLEFKSEFTGKGNRDIARLDPAVRAAGAMGMVMSTYEPTYVRFSKFHAPVTGRYRLRLSAQTFWMNNELTAAGEGHRAEPVTLYAEVPPEQLRKLASFDVTPNMAVREAEVLLHVGETIRPDAVRLFRPRPMGRGNPNGDATGMPGVAFQWLEVEGPLIEQWPPAGHQLLFGGLPLTEGKRGVEVTPLDAAKDAERLLRGFLAQAYRGPVAEAEG